MMSRKVMKETVLRSSTKQILEARVEQHEADLGGGEVDHRRVELVPAAEGVVCG
jgi:hypothetical protein